MTSCLMTSYESCSNVLLFLIALLPSAQKLLFIRLVLRGRGLRV